MLRKYRIVNAELIKEYTSQDREDMDTVIRNTCANIKISPLKSPRERKKRSKSVQFLEEIEESIEVSMYSSIVELNEEG